MAEQRKRGARSRSTTRASTQPRHDGRSRKPSVRAKQPAAGPEHPPTQPRAFWSGTITFGLVSIPVELYTALKSERLPLRMLSSGGEPLRRQYVCPADGQAVRGDELVKAFKVARDEYVVVTDEELAELEPRKSREIDLRCFVDRASLDPLLFEHGYFLAPAGEVTKPYRLLAQAMERSGRAGIASSVMRGKEYLVAIVADNGILRAEILRFAGEVRSVTSLGLPAVQEPDPATLSTLEKAVSELEGELELGLLEDDYNRRLRQLVEEKRRAGVVLQAPSETAREEAEGELIDVVQLLKQRLGQAEHRAG
jgi:DNA end-binding protein Ku